LREKLHAPLLPSYHFRGAFMIQRGLLQKLWFYPKDYQQGN
jgi:hypothetical protein